MPDDEPAAAPDPDPAAVPYRPAPLRFLRRNKTAPVPGAGSLSPSSSTGDCGGSGAAGGIGVPAAVGWGHLMVAGGVGGAGAATQQPQQAQQVAPQPLACFSVAASAVPAVAEGAAGQQQQQQHVHRNITWPVYNNPLACLPPSEPSCGSLAMRPPQPAAVAVDLPGVAAAATAVTVAAAGAAQQGARPPSPPHSHTSTPQDSAQDLEAGTAGGPDKSSGSLPSKASTSKAGGSSKAGGATTAAAAAALPAGPVFGALQYRLPGAPPTGPGSGDTTPEPRGECACCDRMGWKCTKHSSAAEAELAERAPAPELCVHLCLSWSKLPLHVPHRAASGRRRWCHAGGIQHLLAGCSSADVHHLPLRLFAGRAKALVRTRVEPKTFFANERTFLQWLQIRWGWGLAAWGGVVERCLESMPWL